MAEPEAAARLPDLLSAARREPQSAIAQFALGRALQKLHRLAEAVASYEKAIAINAGFVEAHCNLALALLHLGRPQDALESSRRAVSAGPASHDAHNIHGLVLQNLGRTDEAADCYRRAIALKPEHAEAHANLGALAGNREDYAEAASYFRQAIELAPGLPQLRYNLGCALIGQGEIEGAIAELGLAVKSGPDHAPSWSKLGRALQLRGRLEEALHSCSRAVQIAPDSAEAIHLLGVVLRERGQLVEAMRCFERAASIAPDFGAAPYDLAIALQQEGRFEAAVDSFRRAIAVSPTFPGSYCGLGIALGELGQTEEAIAMFEAAIRLKPDYQAAQSGRLLHLHYSSRHDPGTVFEMHRAWAETHARPLAPQRPRYPNARDLERRLRVGYVSPDFRRHSLAFFLAPVFVRHDRRSFDVFCYSDVRNPDEVTRQLRAEAQAWRDVAGLSDDRVAALVREDRIDILVDLAVHSGSNRLMVFARKPAPIQATWLGYAGTTGLSQMDYKITDPILDPLGKTEAFHSEELIRLPDCYWCYTPPPGCPEISPLPASASGEVTFCAFQNLAKVSPPTIELWSRVLRALPRSRLIVKARGLGGEPTSARLRAAFAAHGAGDAQLQLEDWSDMRGYLERFADVDLGLDTTPFNGGTTTCHALCMGVPVVTLAGESALGRMGASVLHNVGVPELIASSPADFAAIAVRFAKDLATLAEIRRSLRARLAACPLTDAGRFTANLEAAYLEMWRRWCAGQGS